jgi:CRISPR-associated endoribonuclease Cas6/Csy4 subtype I-F
MRAKCYLDIQALGTGEETPQYAVIAKALHILHGAFAGSDGQFAIALPNAKQGKNRTIGHTIRIFAESSKDLYGLIEGVKGHHLMRDYVQMSMPKDVPENFSGTWTAWRRVRIQKKEGINKERTIQRVKEAAFFEMPSSNGHVFPIYIFQEPGQPQTEPFNPNSYGFASLDNLFSLPDLP